MKKTLLTMCALFVAIVAANAQKLSTSGKVSGLNQSGEPTKMVYKALKTQSLKVNKPLAKVSLDADERLVGYYTTNEEPLSYYPFQYYGGTYEAGTPFFTDVLGKSLGGQLTKARIYLAEGGGNTTVSVYEINQSGSIAATPSVQKTIATTVKGWNDVTFDKPLTLSTEASGYFVTYTFTISGQVGYHNFMVDDKLNTDYTPGGIYLLGDFGDGYGLYTLLRDANLCIQLVVKGGSYSDDDIVLTGVEEWPIVQRGNSLNVNLNLKNDGNNIPSSYSLKVLLDGNEVETLNTPVALSDGETHSYTYQLAVPADLSKTEAHKFSISVANINGNVPSVNTSDDVMEGTFRVYGAEDVVEKQKTLVEQITSSGCPNCPFGYDFLNALSAKRNDLVWVAAHTDYGIKDEYTTAFGSNIASLETMAYPSASFNRAYITNSTLNSYGTLAMGIGFRSQYIDTYTNVFDNMIDAINANIPAFASVKIEPEYNAETRELKVKVSGEGKEDVQTVLRDGALTVFLTEDGLKGLQYYNNPETQQQEQIADYPHDHVLRYALDGQYGFGEPMNWTSGTTYSNEYTITLDEGWNVDNMNIVAFIGRPVQLQNVGDQVYISGEINDLWVSNAEAVKLDGTSSGINDIISAGENAVEVARYALDGTQLSVPTKGVNIVKMSDGTTKKVIVK